MHNDENFFIVLVSDNESSSMIYEAFIILKNSINHNRITIPSSSIEDLISIKPTIVIFDDVDEKLIPATVVGRIKEISPHTHFIYFSKNFNEDLFENIIKKKIDYCICYDQFSPKLLYETITNILEKVIYIKKVSKIIICGNDISVNLIDRKVWKSGKLLYLTNFEYETLKLLLLNKNKYIKREEIFETVWGYDKDNTGLVPQYVFKLKKKIGSSNILNSPKKGYCFKIKNNFNK